MAEYIDRDLTEKALMERCNETGYGGLNRTDVKMVMRTPWRIPNADVVELKRGRWIWDDEGYHCSECFFHAYGNTGEILSGDYHFCPNCGARMESEGEA